MARFSPFSSRLRGENFPLGSRQVDVMKKLQRSPTIFLISYHMTWTRKKRKAFKTASTSAQGAN